MKQYDPELLAKPRWLVFNKIDALPADEIAERVARIVEKIEWTGPVFAVSAIAKEGTQALCQSMMDYLNESKKNPE